MRRVESSTTAAYLLRAIWIAAMFAAALIAWVASAEAAQPRSEDGEHFRQIAVVSLGDTTSTTWIVRLAEVLDDGNFAIVHGEQLEGRLRRSQVTGLGAGTDERLDRLAGALEDGIDRFHDRGNEAAIEELATPFERALDKPEAFADRPAFAERLFRAGMILVRAYRNLGQSEGAKGIARDLYRYLPGLEPSLAEARLEDIHFYYRERAEIAATGAKLTVPIAGDPDCQPYLNGTKVAGGAVKVGSEQTHFLTARCGRDWGPTWRVDLRPGEYATVPISQRDPRHVELERATERERRRTSEYLRVITHWASVSATVGVGRPTGTDDAPYVAMRAPEDGDVTWAQVDEVDRVQPAVRQLLPSVAATSDTLDAPRRPADSPRWVDWTLVAAGSAGLTAGTTFAAVTELRGRRRPPDRRLRTARAGYLGTLLAGAGLTTWGLGRHLTREPDETGERTAIRVQPVGRGVHVTVDFPW